MRDDKGGIGTMKTKLPKWMKNLKADDRKHLKENHIKTLRHFRECLATQTEKGFVCYDCIRIKRLIGIE